MKNVILFRTCNAELESPLFKDARPSYFSKVRNFDLLVSNVFEELDNAEFHVVFDGDDCDYLTHIESFSFVKLHRVNFKNNHNSLMHCLSLASDLSFDNVYFVEDDYSHKKGAGEILVEGLSAFGLITLYDHPDRYTREDDITKGKEEIQLTESSHWRTSESTTCTWACTKLIFEKIKEYAISFGLMDRDFFRFLYTDLNIRLWVPIPGYSSHLHEPYQSPLVNWERINEDLSLTEICDKYKTDKGTNFFDHHCGGGHLYSEVYSYFLDPLRHDSIKIFELGIAKGASLLAFADYFSNAKIVGLDINPDIVNRNLKLGVEGGGWELIKDLGRIDLREGNQSDENVLLDICQDYDNEFDIIIDDGSHATKDQLKSFDVLYKHVKSNGFYIIEDVHCDALKDDGLLNIFIENIKKNRIDDSKFCGIFYTNPDSLTIILQKKDANIEPANKAITVEEADKMNIVQIGCNDCDLLDSVKDFIINNASEIELAILVDPNSTKIANCVSVYEGVDVNIELVNKAITVEEADKLTLYFSPKETNGQHTSVNRQHLLDHNHLEDDVESFDAPAININRLLEEYNLEVIDRLYIDTEGYDIDILRSVDFSKYKIKYIQFESEHSDGAFSGVTAKLKSFMDELSNLGYIFLDSPPGECIACIPDS